MATITLVNEMEFGGVKEIKKIWLAGGDRMGGALLALGEDVPPGGDYHLNVSILPGT